MGDCRGIPVPLDFILRRYDNRNSICRGSVCTRSLRKLSFTLVSFKTYMGVKAYLESTFTVIGLLPCTRVSLSCYPIGHEARISSRS